MGHRRINILLADTPLFGGTKVALQQANLLARRGHAVTVVTPGPRPDWFELEASFLRVPVLESDRLPPADVNIATFWTTLPVAAAAPGRALHYCQGFEASYTHNHDEHPAILEAYRLPVPAVVVSPHLAVLLEERFGRASRVVPQPLEPAFRPRWRLGPRRRPRLLVVGPFEIDWKGVITALEAVRVLRDQGFGCRLERLSQWPLGEAERAVLEPDRFHCHLSPPAVARLLRSFDLLIAPSWSQEGFGLPALEAMASGVPVVASDVPSFRNFASDAVVFAPPRNAEAFAAAIRSTLRDRALWRRLRRRGREVAALFGDRAAGAGLEEAIEWVLESEPPARESR